MATKPIVYLAGPMDGRDYHEVHDWRNKFKKLYGAEYCLDPTRREYEKLTPYQKVIHDMEDIDKADIVVALVDNIPSIGTSMEIMYSAIEHIKEYKIILINKTGKNSDQLSCWYLANVDHIVTSVKEAVELCRAS